jgi:hypothetical protein
MRGFSSADLWLEPIRLALRGGDGRGPTSIGIYHSITAFFDERRYAPGQTGSR